MLSIFEYGFDFPEIFKSKVHGIIHTAEVFSYVCKYLREIETICENTLKLATLSLSEEFMSPKSVNCRNRGNMASDGCFQRIYIIKRTDSTPPASSKHLPSQPLPRPRVGHRVRFRYERSVLLKNATFFSVLFSSFWQLMRPKRTQRTQRSFAKNLKERKNVLFFCKRTQNVAFFSNIYI